MDREDLVAFAAAWNRHDIDAIMAYMHPDCVFESGSGTEAHGTRTEGHANVRARFVEVWQAIPDVQFENGRHFVDGDRGCSEWTLTGTRPDGGRMAVNGCDLFTFRDGRILVKNTLLKSVAG